MTDQENMQKVMKQAQEVQKKMQIVQSKVTNLEVKGESGAGMVVVTLNGAYEVKNVFLDPELLKEDKKMIEDLIRSAFNDAKRKIEEVLKIEMMKLSKELGLPGEGDFGGSASDSGIGKIT